MKKIILVLSIIFICSGVYAQRTITKSKITSQTQTFRIVKEDGIDYVIMKTVFKTKDLDTSKMVIVQEWEEKFNKIDKIEELQNEINYLTDEKNRIQAQIDEFTALKTNIENTR